MKKIDWIKLEFFAGYPFGHYSLRFKPDGTLEYFGEGEDLPMYGNHVWNVSPRIYSYLTKKLIERRWEREDDPGEKFEVCDGWTDVLSWSVGGVEYEYSLKIGVGPVSIMKTVERLRNLLKAESRNHPTLLGHISLNHKE